MSSSRESVVTAERLSRGVETSFAAPNEPTLSRLMDPDDDAVSEKDSELETCRRIGSWGPNASPMPKVGQSSHRREVLEYFDGVSSTTILGDLLARQKPRNLVRVLLREPISEEQGVTQQGSANDPKQALLRSLGALDLPSRLSW